ncbi:MAG: hypothetical protein ACXQTA_01350 [Candidatus Syntropharchaeales archaeon]
MNFLKEVKKMSEIWTTETVEKTTIVFSDGETVEREGSITARDLMEIVQSHGLRKFRVYDENRNPLGRADFPRNGTIKVEEYNEAKC